MLDRILEPEVMDSADEALEYDRMDHSHVNRVFVDDFLSAFVRDDMPNRLPYRIFDAGTGTALIPIELLKRRQNIVITASDLAESMLVIARQNVSAAGLGQLIDPVLRDCKRLPDANASYDAVMSNSIIHHIPDPLTVLRELWRILKLGGTFFIRDLMRPNDRPSLESLVARHAVDANDYQRRMFRESLHAALSLDEVRSMVAELGLPPESAQATSDRHWTIRV